jgi:DNA-binding MarR family transcriptional regulator
MNIFEELGPLALATRLKQLSENLAKDIAEVYKSEDISFEPRWFTFFYLLDKNGSMLITELARELKVSHVAIVQLTNLLQNKDLIISTKDKEDERKRIVSLSEKGTETFQKIKPLLNSIEQANKDLLFRASPNFLSELGRIESELANKSMFERVNEHLKRGEK